MAVLINITEEEAQQLPPEQVTTWDLDGEKQSFEVRHAGYVLETWEDKDGADETCFYATIYDASKDRVFDLEYTSTWSYDDNYASIDVLTRCGNWLGEPWSAA